MQVTLSNCTVTLKDELTWGDSEEINAESIAALELNRSMVDMIEKKESTGGNDSIKLNGKAILAAKYKAAELIVQKIVQNDGTEAGYTKEWLRNLSVSDGNLLDTHITLVRQGKATPKK